jgi:hypothetical protein
MTKRQTHAVELSPERFSEWLDRVDPIIRRIEQFTRRMVAARAGLQGEASARDVQAFFDLGTDGAVAELQRIIDDLLDAKSIAAFGVGTQGLAKSLRTTKPGRK